MTQTRYTAAEAAKRAHELYDERIRGEVEGTNRGSYLVLDIETGEYEIGEDYLALSRRMLQLRC